MPDTFTANYNLTKPEPNASRDTWGTKWNANLDELDTIVKGISDNRLPYNPTTKSTASEVNFTGVRPKAGGVDLATKNELYAHLPAGTIVLWWGPINAIPAGWAYCDGNNGTPNLMGRVPVGATAGVYPVGGVGGATSIALAAVNLPPHYHGIYFNTGGSGGHSHGGSTSSNGNHNHTYSRYGASNGNVAGGSTYFGVNYGTNSANTQTDGAHTHSISTDWVGDHVHLVSGNTDYGPGLAGAAFSIMQPYICIAYIMKLAAPAP